MRNETIFAKLLKEYQAKNKIFFKKLETTIRAEPYMEDTYNIGMKMFEFGFHINNSEPENFENRYCLEVLLEKLYKKGVIRKAIAEFKSYEWCRINTILCVPTLDRDVMLIHYGGTGGSYSSTVKSSYEIDQIPEIKFDKIVKIIVEYNRGKLKKKNFFTFESLPIPLNIR